mmetsp:Transcript_28622/g.75189  ORF Transcript_28622/g.75189 Transcript_28622/m.75189 type:complete len:1124 (+) Transcript_28622:110-3481(+)|eukprot:CAMPEP_0182921106 /NCGR_PEP_ID=MMETSP0105_2-20130417/3927_1 /TAXON_ID=81532 ORGANISM="Acanthoeca-like sp., Strain 10tr" /NCGR_SAMPLE_ID=MMETSP0105_2 /ASSEMBLY_ACC=CAM_ASM_000205 /LENGTH=1123 /DNA_ID=CAMNT_0025058591 /DNA_START=202 /DNA_END=3573 /DNA_ORIENTATION=+
MGEPAPAPLPGAVVIGDAAPAPEPPVPVEEVPVAADKDDAVGEGLKIKPQDIETIMSATGVSQDHAESLMRQANNDLQMAVGLGFAHKNRVAKGWVTEEDVKRIASESKTKSIMWIDLIGGEGIKYALSNAERSSALNHSYQVVITGPYDQKWTSKPIRRSYRPSWKEQFPFVLPVSSVVYLRVSLHAMSGDVIAAGETKVPVKRGCGTYAMKCDLMAARPGADDGPCGQMLITASKSRINPTSIRSLSALKRSADPDLDFDAGFMFDDEKKDPGIHIMRTVSGPARQGQAENPMLGPDLDALQDDFTVCRTKTSDRVRESVKKYTLTDDGSLDLLLKVLRRRLATRAVHFDKEIRVDTKSANAQPSTCAVCGKVPMVMASSELLRSCGHTICGVCVEKSVIDAVGTLKCSKLTCPVKDCNSLMLPHELKKTVSEKIYDQYEMACLTEFLDTSSSTNCPTCFATIIVEKNRSADAGAAADGIDTNKKDKTGKNVMSRQALKHYNQSRFRCPHCSCSFCLECQTSPFHAGYDNCDAFALAKSGRSCRWCLSVLTDENIWKNYQCKGAIKDTCRESDCTKRALKSCLKVHKCGHNCGGVKNEKVCLPCLECGEVKDVAADEMCTICYCEGYNEAPSLQLKCGHIFHEHCLTDSLTKRWGDTPRIQFDFMKCPGCRQDMEHPHLEDQYIEPNRRLRTKVTQMLKDFMEAEYDGFEPEDKEKADKRGHLDWAEDHVAIELCHKCQLPYNAGRVDCADNVGDEDGPPPRLAIDGVCSNCRDMGDLAKPCPKHGKEALAWKCRYGCHLATYECFNYLHVCNPCHDHNILGKMMDFNKRVGANHPRRGGVPGDDQVYPNKKDIWEYEQCPGGDKCPLGIDHPPTGIEFCFGCTLCKEEATMLQKNLEPLTPLFVKLAKIARGGHDDDFCHTDKDELEKRFLHVFWLLAVEQIERGEITKREAIHALQFLMQRHEIPLDRYEVKLKGVASTLRKRLKPQDLATVAISWRKEGNVYKDIEKTSCFEFALTRALADPTRPIVNLHVCYAAAKKDEPEDGKLSGNATVADLLKKLVNSTDLTSTEAKKITLQHEGRDLDANTKVLPLCAGPSLQLTTSMSKALSVKLFKDCVIQ